MFFMVITQLILECYLDENLLKYNYRVTILNTHLKRQLCRGTHSEHSVLGLPYEFKVTSICNSQCLRQISYVHLLPNTDVQIQY